MLLIRDSSRSKDCNEEEKVGPFFIKHKIGQGKTATVKLAVHSWNGTKAAVKIINKTVSRKRKEANKEIRILSNIDPHPNVISLLHVEEDLENIYLFTEYCEQGDFMEYIERNGIFPENMAKKLFLQMLEAVEFCHKKLMMCHHDIKLENFVLTNSGLVKLIDFGFAVPLSNENNDAAANAIRTFDGSPAYSPLEVLLKKSHDELVDVFGLGACLYYMLCGSFPFCDPGKTTLEELRENVRAGHVDFPEGLVSAPAQDLIRRMLAKRKQRISAHEIRTHTWLNVYL